MSTTVLNRRNFCQQSLLAAIATSPLAAQAQPLPAQAPSKDSPDDPLPIIDTHQHLWDLKKFELPWLSGNAKLRRSYLLADYWQAANGVNILKTIYMEVDVAPQQRQKEVDFVVALAQAPESRMAGAVVGGQPASPQFAEYVRGLKSSGKVKGVRAAVQSRTNGNAFELDRDFVAGIRLLGKNGLSFDINVSPDQLPRAAALIDQAPDTRYVLDHCGNIAPVAPPKADLERWKHGIAEVAKRRAVVCKISGFITNSPGKTPSVEEIALVVDHVCDCFGPDRVMFAGDWPVCTLAMTLAEWVATLKAIVAHRPRSEQRRLFYENAAKFYGV
jgi:predicted TIM-barrel fold metal-dependent hydrolase